MSATTLPLVAAMLLTAAIAIAVACCVWLRVDGECCGCWLFDAGVTGCRGCCCVLCWLREGLCLMLVAAGVVRLLFTWQLKQAICRVWSFLWLGAQTCMLKTSECC
jgi:hypothetical protein